MQLHSRYLSVLLFYSVSLNFPATYPTYKHTQMMKVKTQVMESENKFLDDLSDL